MARMGKRPARRSYARRMAVTTVLNPECTPARVSARALGCRLRIPPACERGETVTHEEYDAWDEADRARIQRGDLH